MWNAQKIKQHEMQGLSKQTLNVETLRDFSIMINSCGLVHDEISYMSNMAFGALKRKITFAKNKKFSNFVSKIIDDSNNIKKLNFKS